MVRTMSEQSCQRSATTPTEVANFLQQFNDWRRGAESPQPDPIAVGLAIDAAIEMLNRLESAEKEAAINKAKHKTPDCYW